MQIVRSFLTICSLCLGFHPLLADEILTNPYLSDGFGSQFQEIICSAVYAELAGKTFVYTPFQKMEHNYDNDPDFLSKKEELINFIDHFPVNTNLEIQESGCVYRRTLDEHLLFFAFSDTLDKIKTIFRLNKQKERYFDPNYFNIAIHVRRPNSHDGLNGNFRYLEDEIYLRIIDALRKEYPLARFHIHSQGKIEDFKKIYQGKDIIFHLNDAVEDAFASMVLADALVTAKSSLSYAAALLSEGEVYYIPFWHPPFPGWIICDSTFFKDPFISLHSNEKIVSCTFRGGLGNQLFQAAATLGFAWDHGYNPVFTKLEKSASLVSPRPVYWDTVFRRLSTIPIGADQNFSPFFEESFLYYTPIEPKAEQMKIEGYFPSAKYFDHHREKIVETFRLPSEQQSYVEKRYQQIVSEENRNTVSIHIRFDDTYLTPIPGVIDFWREPYNIYYDQAIALFPGDVTFVVFSDDCEKARNFIENKLIGRRVVYSCDTDYLDLHLMALCKHNIIVNSTYSWWGAYLNQNPNKIVVSPKFWQMKENTPYRKDVLMPDWTLIDNLY